MQANKLFQSLNDEEKTQVLRVALKWHETKNSTNKQKPEPTMEWLRKRSACSVRLTNILLNKHVDGGLYFPYIQSITKEEFLSMHNAGVKSWVEFTDLRGY